MDLLPALREGVMECVGAIAELDEWKGEPAVFTRRPLPEDAPARLALINPPVAITDADGLTSFRPIVDHDIVVYGRKGMPGSAEDDTRAVERAAFALREHFHRKRFSVQPEGYSVIDVRVTGPSAAPVDDDQTVGRLISVTVRLRRAV